MIRFAGAVGASLLLCVKALAQDSSDLEKKRDEKLAQPFLKKADWVMDYEEVLARSRKQGKLIFAYFTRSYSP